MTREPATCSTATNLAAAAKRMLDADCGILPVVSDVGTLLSVVTNRDMSLVLAAGPRRAVCSDAVIETLQTICAHRLPGPRITAA